MDLTFNLQENKYVAEFEATADFNLHIEGVVEGNIKVYQRTAGGEYAYVRAATPYPSFSDIYDYDFVGVVYPKTMKVVCATEPSVAVVTFGSAASGGSGEGSGGSTDEDVIFFDASKFTSVSMYELPSFIAAIMMSSAFINKTTFYGEIYAGRLPFSDLALSGVLDTDRLSYFAVNNSLTPTIVFMGSGYIDIPEQEGPITFYELLELLTEIGMEFPIEEFKAAEVSREVVEEWLNAQ